MKAHLFYAGQLVQAFDEGRPNMGQYLHSNWGLEIYNGGYIHWPANPHKDSAWYRCDLTPVLLTDVPVELRALCLLLDIPT